MIFTINNRDFEILEFLGSYLRLKSLSNGSVFIYQYRGCKQFEQQFFYSEKESCYKKKTI